MVWHLAQPKHPRKGERNSGEKSCDSKSRAASTPCPHLPLIHKSMEERELDKNTTQPQLVCLRACQQCRTALGHRGQELPRAHSQRGTDPEDGGHPMASSLSLCSSRCTQATETAWEQLDLGWLSPLEPKDPTADASPCAENPSVRSPQTKRRSSVISPNRVRLIPAGFSTHPQPGEATHLQPGPRCAW